MPGISFGSICKQGAGEEPALCVFCLLAIAIYQKRYIIIMKMEIEFFKSGNANPVGEFLDSLQEKERAKVMRNIGLLKQYGLNAGGNFIEPIGEGIFSLRTVFSGVNIRLLFFAVIGNQVVILSGFKKKTNKIPRREIDIARERKKEYLKIQGGKHYG